jgi:hypothetical protein
MPQAAARTSESVISAAHFVRVAQDSLNAFFIDGSKKFGMGIVVGSELFRPDDTIAVFIYQRECPSGVCLHADLHVKGHAIDSSAPVVSRGELA